MDAQPNHVRKHPGGYSMTPPNIVNAEADADARWRAWKARGAAEDQRTAGRMRLVLLLLVAAVIVWSVFN